MQGYDKDDFMQGGEQKIILREKVFYGKLTLLTIKADKNESTEFILFCITMSSFQEKLNNEWSGFFFLIYYLFLEPPLAVAFRNF